MISDEFLDSLSSELPTINYRELFNPFNEEYIEFMPPVLTRQFHQRFLYDDSNALRYQYSWSGEESPEYQEYLRDIKQMFSQKYYKYNPRFVHTTHCSRGTVLLLLDFYMHPLQYLHFINYLNSQFYQVFCPYLHDFVADAEQSDDGDLLQNVMDRLKGFVDTYIQNKQFIVIAHGLSTAFAAELIQDYSQQISYSIFLNGLKYIGVEEPRNSVNTSLLHCE